MTAVPQLLFSKGVNKTPLSLTGIFMYVNPTMQMLIGVLLYHEAFTTAEVLTFSFVWAAVILFVGSNIRNAKRAAEGKDRPAEEAELACQTEKKA